MQSLLRGASSGADFFGTMMTGDAHLDKLLSFTPDFSKVLISCHTQL